MQTMIMVPKSTSMSRIRQLSVLSKSTHGNTSSSISMTVRTMKTNRRPSALLHCNVTRSVMKPNMTPLSTIASSPPPIVQQHTSSLVNDTHATHHPQVDVNDEVEISLEELRDLAMKPCTPLSLADMYKYASSNADSKNYAPQRLRNSQFLYKELPIRVAQRAVDLLTLPLGLNKTKQVQEIAHTYLRYLKLFKDMPCPQNEEDELKFTELLRDIIQDRTSIPMAIAQGVASLKDDRNQEFDHQRLHEMEKALYRFFNARTGLRFLAEHHVLSCKQKQDEFREVRKKQGFLDNIPLNEDGEQLTNDFNDDSFLGCIKFDCDPALEAKRVARQVMRHCRECYGVAPEIEIKDCTPMKYSKVKFTYAPHHLQYMLAELLKNSCRATVQKYLEGKGTIEDHIGSHEQNVKEGISTNTSLPSVSVIITKGAEDVTIKIADKGGGVKRSVIDKMWTFSHSSMSSEIQSKEYDTNFGSDEFTGIKIRGFGLPLARIYARYFGGELTLKSMEGYGVDAYIYLPVLGQACENLPKRVAMSPGNIDSVFDGNHHAYYGDSFSSMNALTDKESLQRGLSHLKSLHKEIRTFSTSSSRCAF